MRPSQAASEQEQELSWSREVQPLALGSTDRPGAAATGSCPHLHAACCPMQASSALLPRADLGRRLGSGFGEGVRTLGWWRKLTGTQRLGCPTWEVGVSGGV